MIFNFNTSFRVEGTHMLRIYL